MSGKLTSYCTGIYCIFVLMWHWVTSERCLADTYFIICANVWRLNRTWWFSRMDVFNQGYLCWLIDTQREHGLVEFHHCINDFICQHLYFWIFFLMLLILHKSHCSAGPFNLSHSQMCLEDSESLINWLQLHEVRHLFRDCKHKFYIHTHTHIYPYGTDRFVNCWCNFTL